MKIKLLLLFLLTSCSVGPNYIKPELIIPASYKNAQGEWKIAEPKESIDRKNWWAIFNDCLLSELEDRADKANQNIAVAEAQYREALAIIKETRANFFPVFSVVASETKSRTSLSATQATSNITPKALISKNTQITLQGSWEPDLWGTIRRQLESDEAAAQASFANLAVVKLSVQASLAQYYFQLRALDNVQFLLDEMVSLYEKFLAKIKSQYMAGTSSRLTVLQAESQLELARIQSADNKVNRSQYEHAIAALIGEPPAHFSIPPVQTSLVVPLIPIEIPSMLLERRPDIANAERLMAEQNALIGVSTAAYFPTLMLTGGRGYSTPSFRHLFSVPSLVWSLGVQLTETLFDAGARSAKIEAASESYQAAVATYRQTVLSAFQEVENYLVKSRIYEDESKMYHKAVRISENEYKYYLNGYNAGISSSLDVLNALFSFYTERKNEITLKSQQMVTAVGLIKALGGNWLDPQLGTVEQN
jgi:NodT family efflux transporter outer membrane factor (OMF) lipoprotein